MAHVIEPASSGRARCRACGQALARGELRFGEQLPNPFADSGDMVLWFHLRCAAYRRPQPLLETLAAHPDAGEAELLRAQAERSLAHRRLPRLHGVERSRSGRARCRSCRELIGTGELRIAIAFYEDGMFSPGGHLHVGCAPVYFETADLMDRLLHFAPQLDAEARGELQAALAAAATSAPPGALSQE